MSNLISAKELAGACAMDPKAFRSALRKLIDGGALEAVGVGRVGTGHTYGYTPTQAHAIASLMAERAARPSSMRGATARPAADILALIADALCDAGNDTDNDDDDDTLDDNGVA